MASKIIFDQAKNAEAEAAKPRSKFVDKKLLGTPEKGRIGELIGTGENAQNSFVWIAIRWSFIVGGLLCFGLFLHPSYCKSDASEQFLEEIKAIWGIFVPIITMALGYAFGKGSK